MSQIKGFLGFLKAGIHYTIELILKLADFLVNGYIALTCTEACDFKRLM